QARGFRVAVHAWSAPHLGTYINSTTCQGITLDGMRAILAMAGPNAEVADAVRSAAARHPSPADLHNALAGEIARLGIRFCELLRKEGPAAFSEATATPPDRERSDTPAAKPPGK